MGAGRPPKFNSPEELQEKLEQYFNQCIENNKMPTKGGLALYLDTTRETLSDYEKKEEFSDAIKVSYQIIEDAWVQKLSGQAVTGTIFYLKNAFSRDWRDKTEQDVTSGGESISPLLVRFIDAKVDRDGDSGGVQKAV